MLPVLPVVAPRVKALGLGLALLPVPNPLPLLLDQLDEQRPAASEQRDMKLGMGPQ